ncbi:MAG: hypothetical protein QXX74_03325 [Candidatus Micrarchaeaceae archaeon]
MANKLNYAMWTILLTSFLGTALMAQTTTMPANQLLSSQLCGIVNGVRTIIGIIALVMFLIGGVLYAIAHFLPSAGQIKGSLQGWAMGMIIGGIVGLILVIIAPYIIGQVVAFGGNSISATSC